MDVRVVPSFADVLALDVAATAVDMPIGLPDRGVRACDVEARARLGPRRSSVFPALIRPLLAATTYPEALALSRAIEGKGISAQSWNLVTKLRDVDDEMTPSRQHRVVEASPELSFALLRGAPCPSSKRTSAGAGERRDALGCDIPRVRGAAVHDVLDACVLTVTARRHLAGTAACLGDGAVDAKGLRQTIVV